MTLNITSYGGFSVPDFSLARDAWGVQPSPTTTGLTFGYKGGSVRNGSGAWTTIADGTIALTDNATNYIERTATGTVVKNTTGFTSANEPMFIVVTLSGVITTVTDSRARNAAPSTVRDAWGIDTTTTTGLTLGYVGGVVIGTTGIPTLIADGTVALSNNATNYVERNTAGVVSKNTTGFTLTSTPMAIVTTVSGAITVFVDWRPRLQVPAYPLLVAEGATVIDPTKPYGDPRRYGAKFDGATFDGTAFTNCLAACAAIPCAMTLPSGTSIVDGIVHTAGVRVTGQGQSVTVLKSRPDTGQSSLAMVTVNSGVKGVHYSGLTLEGFINNANDSVWGVVDHGTNTIVDDIEYKNLRRYVIGKSDSVNLHVTNSTDANTVGSATLVFGVYLQGSTDTLVEKNRFANVGQGGIVWAAGAVRPKVIGNTIISNNNYGIGGDPGSSWAAATGTVTCTAGAATFSSSQAGVIQNGCAILVAGNQYAVSAFNGTTTCTLAGSPTFGATAFSNGAVTGTDGEVIGNNCSGATSSAIGHGISADGALRFKYLGNTCRSNAACGIFAGDNPNIGSHFEGNICDDNTQMGIFGSNTMGCTFGPNQGNRNGAAGLIFSAVTGKACDRGQVNGGRYTANVVNGVKVDTNVSDMRIENVDADGNIGTNVVNTGSRNVFFNNTGDLADRTALAGVANNGIVPLLTRTGRVTVMAYHATGQIYAGVFNLSGSGHTTSLRDDADAAYSVTATTGGKINLYWSAGNARYELENKSGGALDFALVFHGS